MNLVAFGLILICCHAWAIEIDDNFGETYASTYKQTKLENILENLKDTLRNGDQNNGIPVCDPFVAESFPINIKEKETPMGTVILNALLTHLNVTGLSSYQVNSADYKILGKKANADLTWPSVFASTNYVMNGSALGYEVYGEGNMNATVKDFRFQINLNFKLKGLHIQITKVATTISLGGLELHATGLFNDDEKSEAVCKTISDMAPKLIKDNQKLISDTVDYIIMKFVNPILANIKLKDIIG